MFSSIFSYYKTKKLVTESEITLTYRGQTLDLIRIKEKSDGKNSSNYDGTYVVKEHYEKLKDLHDNLKAHCEASKEQYDASIEAYNNAAKRHEDLKAYCETSKNKYEALKKEYETSEKLYKASVKYYEASAKYYKASAKHYEASKNEYEASKNKYEALKKEYETSVKHYKTVKEKCETLEEKRDTSKSHYEASEEKYNSYKKEYDALKDLLSPDAYHKDAIFFLKMFPQKEKMWVEGFCEALLGKIITKMTEKELIPYEYAKCFSPAEAVIIAKVGVGLLQPYLKGAKSLYTQADESQGKKDWATETSNRLFGIGYRDYFNNSDGHSHGLAFIIMIMIMFGNYSFHSGNILITKEIIETVDFIIFTIIDYGAAFRNFFGSDEQKDIWQSLEELRDEIGIYEHKKYLDFYKVIPGLFKKVTEHAKAFRQKTLSNTAGENKNAFESLIKEAVLETYQIVSDYVATNHGPESVKTFNDNLIDHLSGTSKAKKIIRDSNSAKRPASQAQDLEPPTRLSAVDENTANHEHSHGRASTVSNPENDPAQLFATEIAKQIVITTQQRIIKLSLAEPPEVIRPLISMSSDTTAQEYNSFMLTDIPGNSRDSYNKKALLSAASSGSFNQSDPPKISYR